MSRSASTPMSMKALGLVADDKIRAAISRGEFDNLPGFGRPAAIIDEPYDPHWWIRRKLKAESLRPKRPSEPVNPDRT